MGGMVVSNVAEKNPAKIKKLVYIGAFVPANGQLLMELSMWTNNHCLAHQLFLRRIS
jgi:pimeloyl-ACP methyl ester carboxylesterase